MADDRVFIVCNQCAEAGEPSALMLAAWMWGFSRTPSGRLLEDFLDVHDRHGSWDYDNGGIAAWFSLVAEHEFGQRNLIYTNNSNVIHDLGVTDAPIEDIILQAAKDQL
jgi:hypothetical protein